MSMDQMTPREIVSELDKYIIGQKDAKRSVAIALRNRWRRQRVEPTLRAEISPKNILMMGPTGVGKTEIARRLAALTGAPFIKVEATKFTEVGYVGRDVDSIIRDLAEVALKQTQEEEMKRVRHLAEDAAEERILDIFVPPARNSHGEPERSANTARQVFRKKLRQGELNDKEIEIELQEEPTLPMGGNMLMEELAENLSAMYEQMQNKPKKRQKMTVKKALELLTDEEASKRLNKDDLREKAREAIEQRGIVFIDEIDKIATNNERGGGDVSRQGVQRDLLPMVEGTSVKTKLGMIKTDHILFIASGAFHLSKPSDLIPELQGRFPIRVELQSLTEEDFVQILSNTDASLIKQYKALMATDGVELDFTPEGIRQIAKLAYMVNEEHENIGARRLYTVMERLLEDIAFNAPDIELAEWTNDVAAKVQAPTLTIDVDYVKDKIEATASDINLAQYIL